MTSPLLTLGPVDRIRVQVGYRVNPDGPAYQQFLLDLPVPGADITRILAILEPVLFAGADTPRHYSLHQHQWHTSWGASPGDLDLGLFVTTGTRIDSGALCDGATRVFDDLLDLAGRPDSPRTSRATAILLARKAAATAYAQDPEALSLTTEAHHPAKNSWMVRLHTTAGDEYDVVVGLVDGYAGSVQVQHGKRIEVFDSVGSE